MDYSYLNQPATDPNYHNQINQNGNNSNLLNDDQDKELLFKKSMRKRE